jgi:predicted glycoside hydrolase/deacetylase ChbG (UPF0249 family)
VLGPQIIINADDLGISSLVNDAIFELMANHQISSATLIANAPALRDAAPQLKRFPRCSFGAHLNLTQFEPLTGGQGAKLLVNQTGQLSRDIETAFPTIGLLRAAYDELCAQFELLVAAGISISHLDSHNHVHTRPHIFPVLKAVQKRYGIHKVRLAKNLYSVNQPCSPSLSWMKGAYNAALRRVYRTHTTDAFTEFLTYVEVCRESPIRYRSVELMVHPGASSSGADETALLQSDWLANLRPPVELINYRQLAG